MKTHITSGPCKQTPPLLDNIVLKVKVSNSAPVRVLPQKRGNKNQLSTYLLITLLESSKQSLVLAEVVCQGQN